MSVKARSQVTVLDITDGYTVNLSTDSYTFAGDTTKVKSAQTFSTTISAYQGTKPVSAAVDVTAITPTVTGLTISSDNDASSPTLTFSATTALTAAILDTAGHAITIPVEVNGGSGGGGVTINKSVNLSIALTGGTGAAGYTVLMGNEAQVLTCDKDGKTTAATQITIPFSIYQGTARKAATVTYSTLPTGISLNKNTAGTTSAEGKLILDVASGSNLGGADSGTITLTFKTGSTTIGTGIFTWSKSITGATGQQGNTGTAATNVVCGNEAATIACTKDGKVLAAGTIVVPFAGYIGTARAACTVAVTDLPTGMTVASGNNVAATTSKDGSLTITVAKDANLGSNTTYNGEITLTFTCNSQTFVKKLGWSKSMTGATGAQGNPGDDAIAIAIISSNGTVFKNSSGTTTLTAYVYQGGVPVTGDALTALGTLTWYKGDTATGTTGTQQVVAATDVSNTAVYEVRLEA